MKNETTAENTNKVSIAKRTSKSGTMTSFKTLLENLEATELATKKELETLTKIREEVKKRWIETL